MGWRSSKTRNIIFQLDFSVVVVVHFAWNSDKIAVHNCWCIKAKSRSQNDSIVESIDITKHKQLVNSTRKRN